MIAQQQAKLRHACEFLGRPPASVYSNHGIAIFRTDPVLESRSLEDVNFRSAAASVLREVGVLVEANSDLLILGDATTERLSVGGPQTGKRTLIQEIAEDPRPGITYAETLLACAGYVGSGRHSSPWAHAVAIEAAIETISQLRASLKKHLEEREFELRTFSREEVAEPFLLLLPTCMQLVAGQADLSSQPRTSASPTESGLGAFERAVSSAQVWGIVQSLHLNSLPNATTFLLPSALAISRDPLPSVASYGMWSLHHIATEAPGAVCGWPESLFHEVIHTLGKSSDATWPAASQMAVAVVCAVEGDNVFGQGYRSIMDELVRAGELRFRHKRAMGQMWLTAITCITEVLGLACVPYIRRLLPLLLEWAADDDPKIRIVALRGIQSLIASVWPRLGHHAASLLDSLQQTASYQLSSEDVDEEVTMLWKSITDTLLSLLNTAKSKDIVQTGAPTLRMADH